MSQSDIALRLLTLMDAVFLFKSARAQVRNELVAECGSAALAWGRYRRVLSWWAFRTPVGYLLAAGVFKVVTERLDGSQGFLGVVDLLSGASFLAAMIMSVAAALKLLPIRLVEEPPGDWVEFEAVLAQRGE